MAPLIQRRLNQGQSSSVEFRLGLYVAGGTLDAVSWFEPHFEEHWHLFGIMLIFWITDTRGILLVGYMEGKFISEHYASSQRCPRRNRRLQSWQRCVNWMGLFSSRVASLGGQLRCKDLASAIQWGRVGGYLLQLHLCQIVSLLVYVSAGWLDFPFTFWAYTGLQKSVLMYPCAVGWLLLSVTSIYGGYKLRCYVDGVRIRLNQTVGE